MCLTPLAVRNSFISALVNGDPLSDTIESGIPWVANRIRSLPIVVADDADFTGKRQSILKKHLQPLEAYDCQ